MFSHITVGSKNLTRAGNFYDALLSPLGLKRRKVLADGGPLALSWHNPQMALPIFYVYEPFNGAPAQAGNGAMVAFTAASPALVDIAYKAGIEAGGRDAGPPGERPHYAADYYGAYLYDPDGNKVHIVYRGDIIA